MIRVGESCARGLRMRWMVSFAVCIASLCGDSALAQVVDTIAGEDSRQRRSWELLLGGLVDAMAAVAVRESVIDFPMGTAFWGQKVTAWEQVPMPMTTPAAHNPALLLDWRRFSSDTCVAFVRMQVDLLHRVCPSAPVTTNLRAFATKFDYFDMAESLDFVSLDSDNAN